MGVLGLALAADQGGYVASRWTPVALVALGLALAVAAGIGPAARTLPPPLRIAIAGLVLFAGWSLLSVAWAGDRSIALAGGARTAFYAVALVLALVHWPRGGVSAALGLVVAGAGAIAAVTLVRVGSDAQSLFVEGRLSAPLGYSNATANFWLLAFFPALGLAVDRRLAIAVRAGALGVGALLLQVSLISQSRGAVAAFGLAAVAFGALHPRRGPVLAALAATAAAVAASSTSLLAVRGARSLGGLGSAAAHAATMTAVTSVVLGVGCAATLGLLARFAARSPTARFGPRIGDLLAAGLLVAGIVGWLVAAGNPVTWTTDRWHDFKSTGYSTVESGATRFNGSLGSSRYDFYRVALDEFLGHPLLGIGAENFQTAYLRHRRSPETPVYAHSLELGILAEGGLVGAAAFLLFLGGLLVGVRRSLRALGTARGPAVAALCGGLVWLIHSSVDWLWAFPGLVLPAVLLLAVAAGADRSRAPEQAPAAGAALDAWGRPRPGRMEAAGPPPATWAPDGGPRHSRLRTLALATPVAALLTGLFVLLGVASHFERSADAEAARDPARARVDFGRAADFDPFAAGPLISGAILARRSGALVAATQSVEAAIGRQRDSWFAHFELGLLSAESGDLPRARVELSRARRLDPRESVIMRAEGLVAAGSRVDPGALEAELAAEQSANLGPVGN